MLLGLIHPGGLGSKGSENRPVLLLPTPSCSGHAPFLALVGVLLLLDVLPGLLHALSRPAPTQSVMGYVTVQCGGVLNNVQFSSANAPGKSR